MTEAQCQKDDVYRVRKSRQGKNEEYRKKIQAHDTAMVLGKIKLSLS